MLPGFSVRDIYKLVDERGLFAEILRNDWKDLLGDNKILQVNLSRSLPGVIRAWHRHSRGQIDYLIVLDGVMKICAYDDNEGSPTKGHLEEVVVSCERLQMVRVPGHYWHGTKTLGHSGSLSLYFVTQLYDPRDPDEERRAWNDPRIIDPKTEKPFDWNRLPHK